MPGLCRSGNWNENNLNPLTRTNWRASLVPAAAVIPAPIAYIKVVAVKKLVVGFLVHSTGLLVNSNLAHLEYAIFRQTRRGIRLSWWLRLSFTVKKLGCSKQAYAMNTLAWNNEIGFRYYFVGLCTEIMINRNSVVGIRISLSEVKFLDLRKTNDCESIYQGCFH